jgi:integrase
MSAIRRPDRGAEWWVDFRWRGQRVRRRAPLQTKRGAAAFELQLRNEFSEDEAHGVDPFAGPPPTFAEFADRWMQDYAIPRNRPTTIKEKRKFLRLHLLPVFGRLRLDQISDQRVEQFAARMTEQGLSPKTVNNALSVFRTCLATARRWRLVRAIPEIPWLRVPETAFRVLTTEEESALVNACDIGFWQTLVVFILHTGVRFSEAAALTWEDLLLDRPQPVIRICKGGAEGKPGPTKTGSHREVPLDPVVLQLLERLPRWNERIFPTPGGKQMHPSSKSKYLYRFCDRAGIKRHGWHVLRHTYATRLASTVVPVPVVQKLLGHTTLKMTMRYVHVDPKTMAATASVVVAVMAAPSEFGRPVVPRLRPPGELPARSKRPAKRVSALPSRKPTPEGRPSAWSG